MGPGRNGGLCSGPPRFALTARRALAAAIAALVVQAPALWPPSAAADPALAADAKIDPALLVVPEDAVVEFWLSFKAEAELGAAARTAKWAERGQVVVDRLQQTADASQEGVTDLLARRGIEHESFWISNAVRVNGSKSLMRELAARPEVERVLPDRPLDLPDPIPAAEVAPAAVEWGVAAVNAPAVWDEFAATGAGIVVANLDTGVQFNHPALVHQYRGYRGATFDHNYNWFDPSRICGSPSTAPCDNQGHGTHTMGTMVGDDQSGLNRVGVAPGASWIAVKGCEYDSCSFSALMAGGQWLLAPTDLNGQNPRPDLRPNVVNNSWGGGGQDFFFRDIVTAWVAAGIFPAFSNGNSGPTCNTAGSPADYAESYAVGAYDSAGAIASFSSRGSPPGLVKPDIAAPGRSVRSSLPGNSYGVYSGTSMAAPHVAGTVALLWSAAPRLLADVAATRGILDLSAVDVDDTTCGGTAADNGVWGQGRLDARAAVELAPRGPTGTVSGLVVDQATGQPIAGAQIRSVDSASFPRLTQTNASGAFHQVLPVGSHEVAVSAFGYLPGVASITVAENAVTVANFSLLPGPRHAVRGLVRDDDGRAVEAATVSLAGAPIGAITTDPAGTFLFPGVPEGTYQVAVSAGNCLSGGTRALVLTADAVVDFELDIRRDGLGYTCHPKTPAYIEADNPILLAGDDVTVAVPLPFPFSLYGTSYATAYVSTNGVVGFAEASYEYLNAPIPSSNAPNGALYAFWDDLYVDNASSVRTATLGMEPTRRFVVEWRNVRFYSSQIRFDFEVVIDQAGGILFQYRRLFDDPQVRGASATIGIEDAAGTTGLAYSYNAAALLGTQVAVRFGPGGSAGNIPPDAVDDTARVETGRSVTIPVLVNDHDPGGDVLAVTAASGPPHGTAAVDPGGTVTYTADAGFVGTDAFTYDITDGRGGTDRASVSVLVEPASTTVANDDAVTTPEDTPVFVAVLANDAGPHGAPLHVDGVSPAPHGSVSITPDDRLIYVPHADYSGADTFVYSVTDGNGGSDQATVTITVSPVNDEPRARDDTTDVVQGGTATVAVLANDTDVDGDVVGLVSVSTPAHGTATANIHDGTVTYRPAAGYAGPDSFTYHAADPHGAGSSATVVVTVRPGPATLRVPYTTWSQPLPLPLDGIGTWVAAANDPTPTAGQVAPAYLYGLGFGFASGPARGTIGLASGPEGKTAVVSVSAPDRALQSFTVPFAWSANRLYFLFVYQLGPGSYGAWVYDHTAATWTLIGALPVPAAWGKLAASSVTALGWAGPVAPACTAYPLADVFVHAPTGFIGTGTADAALTLTAATDGACAPGTVTAPPGWARYQTGG
ncbi:MAG: Ig-like domain-containing protein [Acidimicrobiales bacterium]